MENSRVRVRYCKALRELANEKNLQKEILDDMQQLLKVVDNSEDFRSFLQNSTIKPSQKKAIIHTLFGDKLHALSLKFLDLVIEYERENMLKAIVYHYIESSRLEQGIRKATLTTAVNLNSDFKLELYKKLEKSMGLKFNVEEKVDAELIGGFILRVDDLQLDASIKGKLAKIKESLINS